MHKLDYFGEYFFHSGSFDRLQERRVDKSKSGFIRCQRARRWLLRGFSLAHASFAVTDGCWFFLFYQRFSNRSAHSSTSLRACDYLEQQSAVSEGYFFSLSSSHTITCMRTAFLFATFATIGCTSFSSRSFFRHPPAFYLRPLWDQVFFLVISSVHPKLSIFRTR